MTVGIQDRTRVGQSDVSGEPGDRVERDGNECLLCVLLSVLMSWTLHVVLEIITLYVVLEIIVLV